MPHSQLVQSVLRGLDILEAVGASQDGLALRELSDRLGLKGPTVHNLARTLAARGFLQKTVDPPRYRLGRAVVELARLQADDVLARRAAGVIRRLFARLDRATVTLNRPVGGEVVTVLRISPERPGLLERPRGRSMHPYGTASALLFQALWTEAERAAYRRRYPFWEYGAHLWGSPQRLERILARARRNGYAAVRLGEGGIYPVAAPVFGEGGELLAAVGASVPLGRGAAADRRRVVERVAAAAKRLSARR